MGVTTTILLLVTVVEVTVLLEAVELIITDELSTIWQVISLNYLKP